MKHQTITNLKFKTLGARLRLPLWQVVGLLESLWLFTIHHARDGSLSRFKPAEIAAWMDYVGDAQQLIDSLVETRWLDRGAEGELLIHDWDEHRPTWLKGIDSRPTKVPTKSATKCGTKSHTKSDTKCGTSQVGLGLVNKKKKDKFTKPTIDQLRDYCGERNNGIDPQEFLDHYIANGWKCGKNQTPMRDWKASVRTWEAKRRRERPAEGVSKIVTPEEYAELAANGELDAIVNGRAGR